LIDALIAVSDKPKHPHKSTVYFHLSPSLPLLVSFILILAVCWPRPACAIHSNPWW